jgi:hypothetical protein
LRNSLFSSASEALPFFKEQDTLKDSVKHVLDLYKLVQQKKARQNDAQLPSFFNDLKIKEQKDPYEKFYDPRRIEIITQFCLSAKAKSRQGNIITTTTPPLKKQPCVDSVANLKPLLIDDMNLCKDFVYKGYLCFIIILFYFCFIFCFTVIFIFVLLLFFIFYLFCILYRT